MLQYGMFKRPSRRALEDLSARISEAIRGLVAAIPSSREGNSSDPRRRSEAIAFVASAKTAAVSGGLALPGGPLGLLSIVPDLYFIWKLQGQMVSDIAAVHGKSALLTGEGMIYCLFKHGAAQLLRELVVTTGRRALVRRASRGVLERIGVGVSERLASKALYRFIPLAGAAACGAFAYYDTARVARTAMDLFGSDLRVDES